MRSRPIVRAGQSRLCTTVADGPEEVIVREPEMILDPPFLYMIRLASGGRQWLPLHYPNDLPTLEGWVRARIRRLGGHLTGFYEANMLGDAQAAPEASFVILFEAQGDYHHTQREGYDEWTITRAPWQVADDVRSALELPGRLQVAEMVELTPIPRTPIVPGGDEYRDTFGVRERELDES